MKRNSHCVLFRYVVLGALTVCQPGFGLTYPLSLHYPPPETQNVEEADIVLKYIELEDIITSSFTQYLSSPQRITTSPDTSSFTEMETRQLLAFRSLFTAKVRQAILTPEEEARLLTIGSKSVASSEKEWETVRMVLRCARFATANKSDFVNLVRNLCHLPRGEKMSTAHGYALREAIELLGWLGTEESVALLLEGTKAGFWEMSPLRSSAISTNTTEAANIMRLLCIECIALAPPDVSFPALERLSVVYPLPVINERRVKSPLFAVTAGTIVATKLWELRTKEGLVAGSHPFQELLDSVKQE